MTAPDLGITDEAEIEAAQQLLDTEWDWRVIGPQKHKERDHYSADCPLCRPDYGDNARRIAHVVLTAAVPLLRKAWEQERGQDVYAEVRAERERAHRKHGETSMESSPASDPTGRRYRVLAEEVGEVAREFNDAEHDHRPVDLAALRGELIQVAAMAAAWADACSATSEATQTEGRSVA